MSKKSQEIPEEKSQPEDKETTPHTVPQDLQHSWQQGTLYYGYSCISFLSLFPESLFAYVQLDGFNKSLPVVGLKKISHFSIGIWILLAVNGFVFYHYAIKPYIQNVSAKYKKTSTVKSLLKTSLPHFKRSVFASIFVGINACFFIWLFSSLGYKTFLTLWHNSHYFWCATIFAMFCGAGSFMLSTTFFLDKIGRTLPHLCKIKALYYDAKKSTSGNAKIIVQGFLLVILAIFSIAIALTLGETSFNVKWFHSSILNDRINLALAIISTVLGTLNVYIISVYGLCEKKINALNNPSNKPQDNHEVTKIDSNPCCKYSLSIAATIMFFLSVLIIPAGVGFGWVHFGQTHLSIHSKKSLLCIFVTSTLFALVGRALFADYDKTIGDIKNTISTPCNVNSVYICN